NRNRSASATSVDLIPRWHWPRLSGPAVRLWIINFAYGGAVCALATYTYTNINSHDK
ncbi:MAG: hypothetical protein ACI9KM_001517, partial [Rubritalea sp.]